MPCRPRAKPTAHAHLPRTHKYASEPQEPVSYDISFSVIFDSADDIVGLYNSDGDFIFAVMAECKMFVEFEPTLPNFTISEEIHKNGKLRPKI